MSPNNKSLVTVNLRNSEIQGLEKKVKKQQTKEKQKIHRKTKHYDNKLNTGSTRNVNK